MNDVKLLRLGTPSAGHSPSCTGCPFCDEDLARSFEALTRNDPTSYADALAAYYDHHGQSRLATRLREQFADAGVPSAPDLIGGLRAASAPVSTHDNVTAFFDRPRPTTGVSLFRATSKASEVPSPPDLVTAIQKEHRR